jgi:endonuclease/exonuclease/phosphatase (EEP) superfamily protein YafD
LARRRNYGRYGRNRRDESSVIAGGLVFLTFLLLVAVVLSLFGSFYWVFDLFSHFVLDYIVISAILALLLLPYRKVIWISIAIGILLFESFKLTPYAGIVKPDDTRKFDEVKVLQYNVNRNNPNVEEMTKWIISQSEDVDIVVLSEVTDAWDGSLRRIKWAYPYHISKDMRGGRNMVIFSRLYIDEFEIKNLASNNPGDADAPALIVRGETTGYEIPFVLYGIHPPPPVLPDYAKRRNDILNEVATSIAKEPIAHKLIVADFNSTKFSPAFKDMAKTSGLHDSNEGLGFSALKSTWPSFVPKFFGVAIDNIVLSDNFEVEKKETGPAMGSDHYPVITTLRFMVDENERKSAKAQSAKEISEMVNSETNK